MKTREASGYYKAFSVSKAFITRKLPEERLVGASLGKTWLRQGQFCAMARLKQTRSGWQKLLYLDQHKPDNYVDGSFLKELRRNGFDIYYSAS